MYASIEKSKIIEVNPEGYDFTGLKIFLMQDSRDYVKNFIIIYSELLNYQLDKALLENYNSSIFEITDTYSKTLELLDNNLSEQYVRFEKFIKSDLDSDIKNKCLDESYRINKNIISKSFFRINKYRADNITLLLDI